MDDEKLIRRIVAKCDKAAANTLVQRYYDEMFRYAYRQSVSAADPRESAQDLTQEIFIAALRSLPTYESKKASFRTWLYQVANSRIIDFRRKFHPYEVQIDDTELFAEAEFTEEMQNKALLEKITEHIDTLPSDIQRILRLHLFGEMTFAQIGKAMELQESTVKTKFYRAIHKIKELFRDEW